MAVEETVHRRRNADAALRGGMADPLLEQIGIGSVHQQPDLAALAIRAPALGGLLPAEVPDPHPAHAEATDAILVEGPLGTPIENGIGMREDPRWRHKVTLAASLPGRNPRAADHRPVAFRSDEQYPGFLDGRVTV